MILPHADCALSPAILQTLVEIHTHSQRVDRVRGGERGRQYRGVLAREDELRASFMRQLSELRSSWTRVFRGGGE